MKRDKTCISWCGALATVAVMFAVALSSCTKEPLDGDMQHPGNKVPAGMICIDFSDTDSQRLDTRADELQTPKEEKRIDAAYIFFYGTTEGGNKDKLVKRVSTADEVVGPIYSKILIPNIGLETDEAYRIVVVANGGANFATDDLTVGSSIDLLTDKVTAVTDIESLKTPLLMSGVVDSHIFSINPIARIDIVRQVVKLNVTVKLGDIFTQTYPNAQFGGSTAAVGKVDLSIWNLPSHSFVMKSPTMIPTNSKMLTAAHKEMPWNATDKEWKFTTYAYANPVQGKDANAKDRSTQFILKLPYRLTSADPIVADNYYKIYINETKDAFNPHKTIRNTIYNVAVTVNGFGSVIPDIAGTTVATSVLPWGDTFSQTDPMGEYLKVPSAIMIEYGEEFKLNIQASHDVTVTKTNPKITMTQGDKVITLRSDDMDTKITTPSYDKITVKMGSLTKEIQVSYRPHPGYLMAKYNLTGNADGIIFAGPIHSDYGASFKYGCILPLRGYPTVASTDAYGAEDVLWSPAGMVKPTTWASMPTQNSAFVVHTFESIKKGEGDPCRLLGITNITAGNYDNGLWRLPTIKELEKLVNPSDAVRYWRVYIEPSPQPIPMEARIRYRYSDTFDLWLPFAGGRDVDGSLQFVHNWGMWQANSIGIKTSGYYDGISSECSLSPLPNGRQPFVINGGSPLTKGHSVRCIQQ